jgi:hypothetical protein
MFILSFDVGIKNLAYCYSNNHEIIKWDIIDISASTINDITYKCFTQLEESVNTNDIQLVLIENQPVQKNPKMKSIQMLIFAYFMYKQVLIETSNIENVKLISACKKNTYMKQFDINIRKYSTKYLENKKKSIECTKMILYNNFEWLNFFLLHKKQDDLADSYLQILSYLNYIPVLPKPPSPLSVISNESTTSTSTIETCFNSNCATLSPF